MERMMVHMAPTQYASTHPGATWPMPAGRNPRKLAAVGRERGADDIRRKHRLAVLDSCMMLKAGQPAAFPLHKCPDWRG